MDIEGIEDKEDGWNLIVQEEYSFKKIREFVTNSCLEQNRAKFVEEIECLNEATDENVEKLCAAFLACVDGKNTLDELTSLFVVACMIYSLEGASVESMDIRTNVLYTVFFETDTLSPQHLHFAVQRIWESLKNEDDPAYVMLILSLCRELCIINATGRAVAICLAWTIVCEITDTDFEMYCFQKFSSINTMLSEIDDDMLKSDESTQIVYILIQVVGFLINMIVFSSNDHQISSNDIFIKAGYRHYFKYKRQDLKKLKDWAEQLAIILGAGIAKPSHFWDLRMSMVEYVKMNIISLLDDKIHDIQK